MGIGKNKNSNACVDNAFTSKEPNTFDLPEWIVQAHQGADSVSTGESPHYQLFGSFYDSIEVSPHYQSQLIQLVPGELQENCDAFFTENMALYRMHYNLPCVLTGRLTLDGILSFGLVKAEKPCYFNGKEMEPEDCFVLRPLEHNDLVLNDCGVIFVFAITDRFIESCDVSGNNTGLKSVLGEQEVIRLSSWSSLQASIEAIFSFDTTTQSNRLLGRELEEIARNFIQSVSKRKLLHYRSNSRGNLLSRAIRCVIANVEDIEGCSCVAKRIHTSNRSLEKVFRKYLNITPSEFINIAKMNCFREEVLYGNPNTLPKLSDLSRKFGYTDYASFSKRYKKFYGIGPLQTRRRLNQLKKRKSS